MSLPLHQKYRPTELSSVVGQSAAVNAIGKILKRGDVKTFLLSGPSGTGKTTLARIIAAQLGCASKDVIEVDAATNSGVDATRALQDAAQFVPFGKSKRRGIIVDEAHALSKQAWQSLLKSIEEPPEFMLWFFCTTEMSKVPPTIKTRCAAFGLKEVDTTSLRKLLVDVCKAERIKLAMGVEDQLLRSAHGSPRQLLVNLAMVREAANRKEASDLLRQVEEGDATIELCRFLLKGGSWSAAMKIYDKLKGENPEGVRIVVCNYMASVLKGTTSDDKAQGILQVLDAFSEPFNASENSAPLLLAIGRTLYA